MEDFTVQMSELDWNLMVLATTAYGRIRMQDDPTAAGELIDIATEVYTQVQAERTLRIIQEIS